MSLFGEWQLTATGAEAFRYAMPSDGPTPLSQNADKGGGGRPLAALGCTLRGGHAYVPSRRLDGYETCAHCGRRRRAADIAWLPDMSSKSDEHSSRHESGFRPLAALGCVLRRRHNFLPSRRLEGYDTCMDCGLRRKTILANWFSAPPPEAVAQTSTEQASLAAGPIVPPDSLDGKIVIPFKDAPTGETPDKGVDPKVLQQFLRQIDGGFPNPAPRSSRPRNRRRPTPPEA